MEIKAGLKYQVVEDQHGIMIVPATQTVIGGTCFVAGCSAVYAARWINAYVQEKINGRDSFGAARRAGDYAAEMRNKVGE